MSLRKGGASIGEEVMPRNSLDKETYNDEEQYGGTKLTKKESLDETATSTRKSSDKEGKKKGLDLKNVKAKSE